MPATCTSTPATSRDSDLRPTIWGLAATLAVIYCGPTLIGVFFLPPDYYTDFVQEWLSARNYWAGDPVYLPQTEAMLQRTGRYIPEMDAILKWNAHPPAAVFLTLPFGLIDDYRTAHLAWGLTSLVLLLAAIGIIMRELAVPAHWWWVFSGLALFVSNQPITAQFYQGQLNCVLTFLIAVAWAADRRGRTGWAGAVIGTAAAIKLYPAFLFSYFLFTGRWRAIAAGGVAFAAVNGLAMGVLGTEAFQTYIETILPGLSRFESGWRNVSLTGFWLRAFDTETHAEMLPAARVLVWGSRLLIFIALMRVTWRAVKPEARDRAFAAAILAMLLISPVTWTHYFLLLAIPVGLAWARLPTGPWRWALWPTLLVLWLPEVFFAQLALGREHTAELVKLHHESLGLGVNLLALSVFTYALLALFVLTLRLPIGPPKAMPAVGESGQPA